MTKVVPIRKHIPPQADVCVVELGDTGLPLAVALSAAGKRVVGVDRDPAAVSAVTGGRYHHHDPELRELLSEALSAGALKARTAPEPAGAFILTSMPTIGAGGIDLSPILTWCDEIAPVLRGGELIVLETSGPVGLTSRICEEFQKRRPDLDLEFAYVAERARPGRSVDELTNVPRIVGGVTLDAAASVGELYALISPAGVLITDSRTAEMVKLAENTFRDINIAFANELAMVCGELDLNVTDVIGLANHHPRVNILDPGAGVGGHSISVDPQFLLASSRHPPALTAIARRVNDDKPGWIVREVLRHAQRLGVHSVGCLGLSAKPGFDSVKESPALCIVQELHTHLGDRLRCADPYQDLMTELPELPLTDVESAWRESDLVVVLISHEQFAALPPRSGPVLDFCSGTGRRDFQVFVSASSSDR